MLRNQDQSPKTAVRAAVAFALLAVVGLGWTTSAQAQTQCSGSIILSPDKGQDPPGDVLEQSEALTIGVAIFNTTTVGGVPAAASVRNTTLALLSCATEFPCAAELSSITFDSCTPEAGIASCGVDPMNSNHVLITYTGNAKALAAGGVTNLVTLNVHATPGQHIVNPASGQFFVVGETGAGNIFNANCAGSGQGSAPLFYPGLCGDGITDLELGEQCDDGNATPFDGCGIPGGGANNCLLCPDSTPCPDTDNNECTDAGCNTSGQCDQLHTLPNSRPCTDNGNECAAAGCNGAGACDQLHTPVQDSTPCTDDDGNVCTEAGCQAGQCDQNHVLPNSKPCTDDGTECAAAGCNGAGVCDQLHTPDPPSGPCTDNDGNECTEAGCDGAGLCDQLHIQPNSKPCADDGTECAAAGCNGAGVCDQLHVPAQDSTPCTDTDNNLCTEAGCALGVCQQRHVLPDSKPCPDVANECATAGCDGTGFCDQNHANVPDDTPCTDTDGTECTDPACLAGECDQDQGGVTVCADPVCTSCDPVDGVCKPFDIPPPQCVASARHYMCYEIDRLPFASQSVDVVDEFGESTGTVRRPKRLCLPADKNDEDPSAPLDPNHLVGYEFDQETPRFSRQSDVEIENQFGTIEADLIRPEMLLVPTAKSLNGAPAPIADTLDHYKCYRTVRARQRVSGIKVDDQFGTLTVDIKRPIRYCVAADKNGEGIPVPDATLLCYQVRQSSRPRFTGLGPISIDNQFGASTIAVTRPVELCVPPLGQVVPPTPTLTPTPTVTPTPVDPPAPNCGNGVVESGEQCDVTPGNFGAQGQCASGDQCACCYCRLPTASHGGGTPGMTACGTCHPPQGAVAVTEIQPLPGAVANFGAVCTNNTP